MQPKVDSVATPQATLQAAEDTPKPAEGTPEPAEQPKTFKRLRPHRQPEPDPVPANTEENRDLLSRPTLVLGEDDSQEEPSLTATCQTKPGTDTQETVLGTQALPVETLENGGCQDSQPLDSHSDSDVVVSASPPAMGNGNSQPVENDSQPVENGDSKPVQIDPQPVENGDSKPVQIDPQPVENGDSKPVQIDPQPVENGDSKPVQSDSQPVENGDSKLVQIDPQPLENGDSKPVQIDPQPVENGDSQPVENGDSQPMENGDSKRGVDNGDSQPVEIGDSQPLPQPEESWQVLAQRALSEASASQPIEIDDSQPKPDPVPANQSQCQPAEQPPPPLPESPDSQPNSLPSEQPAGDGMANPKQVDEPKPEAKNTQMPPPAVPSNPNVAEALKRLSTVDLQTQSPAPPQSLLSPAPSGVSTVVLLEIAGVVQPVTVPFTPGQWEVAGLTVANPMANMGNEESMEPDLSCHSQPKPASAATDFSGDCSSLPARFRYRLRPKFQANAQELVHEIL